LHYVLRLGTVIMFVINNHGGGEHPIHLHGHLFWILAQGQTNAGDYNKTIPLAFGKNPLRRDTATVNPNSYVVLIFEANNYGLWVMHCHINWHMMEGLGLVIVEGPEEIIENFGALPSPRTCKFENPVVKVEADIEVPVQQLQEDVDHIYPVKHFNSHLRGRHGEYHHGQFYEYDGYDKKDEGKDFNEDYYDGYDKEDEFGDDHGDDHEYDDNDKYDDNEDNDFDDEDKEYYFEHNKKDYYDEHDEFGDFEEFDDYDGHNDHDLYGDF